MYKVIHFFTDLQDKNYPYNEGDIFPREGVTVSKERLFELSTDKNKQKKPLIQLVDDDKKQETKEYTKTEINRMSTAELQELAKEHGIENAENITGGELKKILIEKFEL